MGAAEGLFAEQGYAATTVAQIAQAAEVNRALLYYYFRDKRDLYWAIMERGLDEVRRLVTDVSEAPGGPWDRVERFVRSYYELLLSRHDVVRMVLREMSGAGERLGLPVERRLRESMACVRKIIEGGVGTGDFQGVDPELTAFSLFGMIHVFFTQRLATGRAFPAEVVVAHTLQLLRYGAHAPVELPSLAAKRGAKRKA